MTRTTDQTQCSVPSYGRSSLASRQAIQLMLAILGLSAIFLAIHTRDTIHQAHRHEENALHRTVESGARELGLYIESLRRSLRVFATEERQLIMNLPRDSALRPLNGVADPAETIIQRKISDHFPHHLAYALAGPNGELLHASEEALYGRQCHYSTELFAQHPHQHLPAPSIHTAGVEKLQHFDVLSQIPGDNARQPLGVLFVSFHTAELLRLLNAVVLEHHLISLEEMGAHGEGLIPLIDLPRPIAENQNQRMMHQVNVPGTAWRLTGWVNPARLDKIKHDALIQLSVAILALLLASLIIWRYLVAEQHNKGRTQTILVDVEEERKRIARDLHDQTLADVSQLRRRLADLCHNEDIPDHLKPQLTDIDHHTDNLATGIRDAINDLHPHALELLGLGPALENYLDKHCQGGPSSRVELHGDADSRLSPSQRLQLFRITVELITNALKHARCERLRIELRHDQGKMRLIVEDDGVGFKRRAYASSRHSDCRGRGVVNIETRASVLGAKTAWSNALSTPTGSRFELTMEL